VSRWRRDAEATVARFSTVVLDVDSTLSGVEGIDWLAGRRDGDTAAFVRRLTDDAMSGRLALEDAYARRLERIAPTLEEVRALAREYRTKVAAGAGTAIERLRRSGVRVIAISGGLREAIVPVCREASFADEDVFAVGMHWDERGMYLGFDRTSPLATQNGKAVVLRALALPRPILAVGDGSTDLAMRAAGAADTFAAYTGFVHRASVVTAADHVLTSFDDLLAFALRPLA
jgi:phosphoserine phosphatase